MSDVNTSEQNRNKRKRKKTFLKNARKYAKKGYYGRGSKLDEGTYQYFVKVMEEYNQGFSSDEERDIIVKNIFKQMEGDEINCCCNQVGCRAIEIFLPFASDAVLKRFMTAFSSDLRPLCCDRFATHVLEALLTICCKKSYDCEEAEMKQECNDFTVKISKFILNNLEDYVWDTYGNHVIRRVFINLASLSIEDKKVKNKVEEVKAESEIPAYYKEIIKDYGERLISWPQFNDLLYNELASGLLQVLLRALKKIDGKLLKKYLQRILDDCITNINEEKKLPKAFFSKASIMLVETYLEVSDSKMFEKFYEKCFLNNLFELSKMRGTNFIVQKVISNVHDKLQFEAMFDEMDGCFSEIIEAGHTGVILAIGESCRRFCVKQGNFVQNMMKALHCFEPEEKQNKFILCACKFSKYENLQDMNLEKEKLNLHGTLIVQLLLDFNKPIKIVNSLLNMETVDLKNLFMNTMGSHIVDSYVKSKYVGEKSREKLIRKLQGMYQQLASTKYGSRSFDVIWNVCNLKQKLHIMNELSHKDALWSNTEYGKNIAWKLNINLYKRNVESWKNSLNKKDNVNALLDIIN